MIDIYLLFLIIIVILIVILIIINLSHNDTSNNDKPFLYTLRFINDSNNDTTLIVKNSVNNTTYFNGIVNENDEKVICVPDTFVNVKFESATENINRDNYHITENKVYVIGNDYTSIVNGDNDKSVYVSNDLSSTDSPTSIKLVITNTSSHEKRFYFYSNTGFGSTNLCSNLPVFNTIFTFNVHGNDKKTIYIPSNHISSVFENMLFEIIDSNNRLYHVKYELHLHKANIVNGNYTINGTLGGHKDISFSTSDADISPAC